MRLIVALAALLAACSAFAQPADERQLLASAQQHRARGCHGQAGTQSTLQWSDALARAAMRMARGENALPAMEKEGFRVARAFHSSFVGYANAADVAAALAAHYCGDLVEPKFTEFGAYRDGRQWTVVLAAPFQLPGLANRRAAIDHVLALVNDARSHARRCGDRQFAAAPALRWNDRLAQVASEHAQDMASHKLLDHKGTDGSSPAQRITRAGYAWRNIGENVAAGQGTAEEVVEDWLTSPGHCANIMEPAFTEMGAGFAVNMKSDAAVYWAQEFGHAR